MLGTEPEWVQPKRERDFKVKQKYKETPWTASEDRELKKLVKQHIYGYDEMSKMLNRTCGAINRRLVDLNIPDRPIKASVHNMWTDEEIAKLLDMVIKGYKYETMAEELPKRSAKALRGYLGRIYGTENLDKIRRILNADKGNKIGGNA